MIGPVVLRYLPVFSRYMCLHASDDDVVLHAAKVVEALWKLEKYKWIGLENRISEYPLGVGRFYPTVLFRTTLGK